MSQNSYVVNVGTGLGTMGGTIAIAISWSVNHSIWWCILHGFCGWFYVIYYAYGGGR